MPPLGTRDSRTFPRLFVPLWASQFPRNAASEPRRLRRAQVFLGLRGFRSCRFDHLQVEAVAPPPHRIASPHRRIASPRHRISSPRHHTAPPRTCIPSAASQPEEALLPPAPTDPADTWPATVCGRSTVTRGCSTARDSPPLAPHCCGVSWTGILELGLHSRKPAADGALGRPGQDPDKELTHPSPTPRACPSVKGTGASLTKGPGDPRTFLEQLVEKTVRVSVLQRNRISRAYIHPI